MQVEFRDVILDGLTLWRLSMAGQFDLWCVVFKRPHGFAFVIDDDPHGTKPHMVHEDHDGIVSLVNRAEAMRRCFLLSGWKDVGVE